MTDAITSTTTTPVAAPQTAIPDLALQQDLAAPSRNQLDKDAFLKLLVAQLKYQDPLDPSDPAEFMATTAQFTTIEKLDELTTQGANNAIVSGLSMASSLVGRQVTFLDADGTAVRGVVTSAEVVGGEVRLSTPAGPVALNDVIGIGIADDQATAATPGSTDSTPTDSTPTDSTPTDSTPTDSTEAAVPQPEIGQPLTVEPPATEPPATEPPATAQPATEPSITEPLADEPIDGLNPPTLPPETPQDDQSIDPPIDQNTDSQNGTADGPATPQQEVNIR